MMFSSITSKTVRIIAGIAVGFALTLVFMRAETTFTQAQNVGPKWSMNAMACVPNGSTAQASLVQTSHGHARYTNGKIGDLYLICPFSDGSLHGTTVSSMRMTYSGGDSPSKISASLRRVDRASGNIDDPMGISTEPYCLSTSVDLRGKYDSCRHSGGGHRIDFERYYYYVQLSLRRTHRSQDPRIVGVTIW